MIIKNLPAEYKQIWDKCLPILRNGRPGDGEHAKEVAEYILSYDGKMSLDLDALIPVAIMHDIGHAYILPEHFKYITGLEKIKNGKLVHMLVGAKIAQDILEQVGYDQAKSKEIVDIISMHDADQIEGSDVKRIYSSENKKIFHDIDSLDRYNERRLKGFASSPEDREKLLSMLSKFLDQFFYDEFKSIAIKNLESLKNPEMIK